MQFNGRLKVHKIQIKTLVNIVLTKALTCLFCIFYNYRCYTFEANINDIGIRTYKLSYERDCYEKICEKIQHINVMRGISYGRQCFFDICI